MFSVRGILNLCILRHEGGGAGVTAGCQNGSPANSVLIVHQEWVKTKNVRANGTSPKPFAEGAARRSSSDELAFRAAERQHSGFCGVDIASRPLPHMPPIFGSDP
jgi:hypothetical protein